MLTNCVDLPTPPQLKALNTITPINKNWEYIQGEFSGSNANTTKQQAILN